MEEGTDTTSQRHIPEQPDRQIRKRPFANVFLVLAILLSAFGIYKMYAFGSDDKIVGGDAYNYIIYAGRGTAWVCTGIVSALIGVAVAVYDLTDSKR